jgi:hypothetical protein
MLSAVLDVRNDSVEGALGNTPIEFGALMVVVLWETGLPPCRTSSRAM